MYPPFIHIEVKVVTGGSIQFQLLKRIWITSKNIFRVEEGISWMNLVKMLWWLIASANVITMATKTWYKYSVTGTIIEQGETPDFYFQKYPEDHPVLGFFTWRWILTFGLDHMFSSPIFLGLLVLFGASLMACTYTTQIPLVKVARRLGCELQLLHVWDGMCLYMYIDIGY